ncbi:hypothetical protein AA101099_0062 [Neoasaia chiangmaiensis NBRC 101099]|uniref:Uncharacterized protein n=1 Tax=Neoasaia chiangmaiensis TaxID=320497 RepID=A0A1U9KLW1_9PROT|nr:hypothetical protein [Neoasaia chiangmaiensis]AQS86765.1 hypothetical protein A0U93_01000 [Neoasaia chiangmaiensis]GBR35530.1 hypothetical protein AA101099_0062 [Neoasaia chiangmaiensis NBRC 101099]GEN16381.1 hypothetical protein NCH01_28120 [Neoasaia chiangmaiensis]
MDVIQLPTSSFEKREKQKSDDRRLKRRLIGMLVGIVLAHVCVGWAIAGTWMDDQGYFHTNYIALAATFFWSMFFLYHVGIS